MTTKKMYRYTKDTLLAFASLPNCQPRPDGIDLVLWRGSINSDVVERNIAIPVVPPARGLVRRDSDLAYSKSPVDDIPEWRSPNGRGAIFPYEEPLGNAFSSSYPPRPSGPSVEQNGPVRLPHDRPGPNGPPGRWDRYGEKDCERRRLSQEWDADEGGPGGKADAGQCPWVERDGLLRSRNQLPPRGHNRIGAQVLFSIIVASLATIEAAPAEVPMNCNCELEKNSWGSWMTLIDGVVALLLGLLWAFRTYLLSQSYSSFRARHWASLRFAYFWASVISLVIGIVAIVFSWCMPGRHSMQSVVAVLIGAFITVAVEQRSQGRPSQDLWTLQQFLKMPFYRAGQVGNKGYADNRTALFQESHVSPVRSARIVTRWERSTWRNMAVNTLGNVWTYYVKPGPINDHCYLGRYELLEAAAARNDPILFAAAFASITSAYLGRLKMEGLQRRVLKLMITEEQAQEWGPGRVRNSFRSWRRRLLARHLLESDELDWPGGISNKLDVDVLSIDALIVVWAVFWLEVPEVMAHIMSVIACHLKEVHADGREWVRTTEEDFLENQVSDAVRLFDKRIP